MCSLICTVVDMPMTTAIEPGPDRLGIASGVKEISAFARASARSWPEIAADSGNSMRKPR